MHVGGDSAVGGRGSTVDVLMDSQRDSVETEEQGANMWMS